MLGCVAAPYCQTHPLPLPIPFYLIVQLESQCFCWQFPLDELRKHTKPKLLRNTLNAMLSVPFSVSVSVPDPPFSPPAPLCLFVRSSVCLPVCLFGSSFRLPVSVSVRVSGSSLVYNKSASAAAPARIRAPARSALLRFALRWSGLVWSVRMYATLSAASNTSMFILQVKRK